MQNEASTPVPLVIYGVPFHNVTFAEAVDWIIARVKSGRPANIVTANLDFVSQAWRDPELQRILIDADLVLADGFPIVKLAPFFGPRLKDRVTGSDLTPMIAEHAAAEGVSIYGLGGADGIAEKAMELLKQRHPELQVAGTFSPPFSSLLEMDHRKILQKLESSKPDILFVALGSPKQEKFISMHVRGWNVPVSMGIGASLDFIVGEQKRAPIWVQKCSLEWFWRMFSDPGRLFSRYLGNVRFLLSATRKMISIHYMSDTSVSTNGSFDSISGQLTEKNVVAEGFPGFDSESIARTFIERMEERADGKHLLLDLHTRPWLDSMELGALLELNKHRRAEGKRLMLYTPRSKVLRLLETCRLTDYFDVVSRLDEVAELLNKFNDHPDGGTIYEEGSLRLELPIELTAATIPGFENEAEFVHRELKDKGGLKTMEVDASRLDFIDSSGLGFLIALKKATQDKGVSMSITHLNPKPRRTFEIARVDKVLLHA